MKIFFWLLVILAGCLYAGSVGCATSLHSSDPAGNGLTFSFGVLMTGALWILLAGIVLIAGIGGEMPGIGGVAACVLVPLSGAAAIAAFNLLNQSSALHWPVVIVILIPMLLLVYAVWAYLPSVRASVSARAITTGVWTVILVLSLSPWPLMAHWL